MRSPVSLVLLFGMIGCGRPAPVPPPGATGGTTSEKAPQPPVPATATSGGATTESDPGIDVFQDESSCRRVVASGRLAPRAAHQARFATWNLRAFPDGGAGEALSGEATNVGWASCVIAWLDADVIALQEVKGHQHAKRAVADLARELSELADTDWSLRFDDCDQPEHVGFLWRRDRVSGTNFREQWHFNPSAKGGNGCDPKKTASPGLTGYFKFASGLDLNLTVVQLGTVGDCAGLKRRRKVFQRLKAALTTATPREDRDYLIVGDYGTEGCPKSSSRRCRCNPTLSSAREVSKLRKQARRAGFNLLQNDVSCTAHSASEGEWPTLDLFMSSKRMAELPADATPRVFGICATTTCSGDAAHLPAYTSLSDHCPVVVDVNGADLDDAAGSSVF